MRIRYNAPVILTFTLLATTVLIIDQILHAVSSEDELASQIHVYSRSLGQKQVLRLGEDC